MEKNNKQTQVTNNSQKGKAKLIAIASAISVGACSLAYIPAIVMLSKKDTTPKIVVDPAYQETTTNAQGQTYYRFMLNKNIPNNATLVSSATNIDNKKYNVKVDTTFATEAKTAYVVVQLVPVAGGQVVKDDQVKFDLAITCQSGTSNATLWSAKIDNLGATVGDIDDQEADDDFDGLSNDIDPAPKNNEYHGLFDTQTAVNYSFNMDYRKLFAAAGATGAPAGSLNEYNVDLAKLGAILSQHVYSPESVMITNNKLIQDMKPRDSFFKQIGCIDYELIDIGYNGEYGEVDKNDTTRAEIAHHKMKNPYDESEVYQVVFLSVRGTSKDNEWISNFDVGYNDATYLGDLGGKTVDEKRKELHPDWNDVTNTKGTDVAANRLWKEVFGDTASGKVGYLEKHGINWKSDKVLFFNCGHSRGAGIANIIGSRIEEELIKENSQDNLKTITYCYASPFVTDKNRGNKMKPEDFKTIHCVVTGDDFVGKVPFEIWNLAKYGQIHKIAIGTDEEMRTKFENEWKLAKPESAKEYAYVEFWEDNVETLPVKDRSEIYRTDIDATKTLSSSYAEKAKAEEVIAKNKKVFDSMNVHNWYYKMNVVDSIEEAGKYQIETYVSGGALIDSVSNLWGPDKEKFDFAKLIAILPLFDSYMGYAGPLAANIAITAASGTNILDVFNHNHSMATYYFAAKNIK